MLIAICIQSPFTNGKSPYAICLGPIPVCTRGVPVPVCKWGLPICIWGCLFCPALITTESRITESGQATYFCIPVCMWVDMSGGKNVCFYLRKDLLCEFLRRDFGKNWVLRKEEAAGNSKFGFYVGTRSNIPQKNNLSPLCAYGDCCMYTGIPMISPYAYGDSPVTNHLHVVVVCIWWFGSRDPHVQKMHMGIPMDPHLYMGLLPKNCIRGSHFQMDVVCIWWVTCIYWCLPTIISWRTKRTTWTRSRRW